MRKSDSAEISPDIYEGMDLSGLSEAAQDAIVTHMLEGIIPEPELIATLRLLDAGEIDLDEFKRREKARVAAKFGEK